MNSPLDPWLITADQFPTGGTSEEKIWFALQHAILAPSSHNSQPWRFKVKNNTVELYADLTRRLPVTDPSDRQLIISCGAALEHLHIGIRYCGHACTLDPFPEADRPTLLARVTMGYQADCDAEELLLFMAIPKRRTNRSPFRPEPVPPALLDALSKEALDQGAWLHVIDDEEERFSIADLIAEGDRHQWHDKLFRRELAGWIRPNSDFSFDGIPGYSEGLGSLASELGPTVIRTFDLGKGQAAKDREIALHSPALAVLGTEADEPRSWLDAGRALARVLLRGRVEDLWASFLNQPIEVADLRPKVTATIQRSGFAQLILRLGFGPDVRPTPRRGMKEVVVHEVHGSVKLF